MTWGKVVDFTEKIKSKGVFQAYFRRPGVQRENKGQFKDHPSRKSLEVLFSSCSMRHTQRMSLVYHKCGNAGLRVTTKVGGFSLKGRQGKLRFGWRAGVQVGDFEREFCCRKFGQSYADFTHSVARAKFVSLLVGALSLPCPYYLVPPLSSMNTKMSLCPYHFYILSRIKN